jgi:3-oxoadipate enol-lactonase
MPTATVNGVSTYYETHGEGPPVLIIHGDFGGNPLGRPEASADAIQALDGVAQVIIYARRNCGKSAYTLDHYGLPDLAADARALLDSLGIDRSIIVGNSMGGMVALQYALDYPENVSALSLVQTGPALMTSTGYGPPMTRVVERAANEGDGALFESRIDRIRNPRYVKGMNAEAHEKRVQLLSKLSDDELFTLSTGEIRNFEAFIGFDYTDRLGELKGPISIIHGDEDPLVAFENAGIMKNGIPHAELKVIEGAGHGLLWREEAQIALRDWVRSVA